LDHQQIGAWTEQLSQNARFLEFSAKNPGHDSQRSEAVAALRRQRMKSVANGGGGVGNWPIFCSCLVRS
jgi:hypothetical protein